MSSKKVASKETKPAEKKAAVKKTATASAAKKSSKTASSKSEKSASKAAPKASAKAAPKAAAKPAAKAAPKTAAKSAPKAAPKETPKAASKAAPKAAAKPASKAAPKAAEKPAPKAVEKVAEKPAPKALPKEETPKAEAPKVEAAPKAASKAASAKVEDKAESKYDYAVLLEGVKKLSKAVMFVEIDEQEDRSNKKKMSSEMKNLEMKPTAAIRHKASLAEETQEELTERILKELEEQNLAFEREAATQMCTRCNRNLVSPEFWVDKSLGYCEECAAILKLGQSKEARKVEYQLGGMGDSLDEEEDEEIVGPNADDLKEAEEDLADMEDDR